MFCFVFLNALKISLGVSCEMHRNSSKKEPQSTHRLRLDLKFKDTESQLWLTVEEAKGRSKSLKQRKTQVVNKDECVAVS